MQPSLSVVIYMVADIITQVMRVPSTGRVLRTKSDLQALLSNRRPRGLLRRGVILLEICYRQVKSLKRRQLGEEAPGYLLGIWLPVRHFDLRESSKLLQEASIILPDLLMREGGFGGPRLLAPNPQLVSSGDMLSTLFAPLQVGLEHVLTLYTMCLPNIPASDCLSYPAYPRICVAPSSQGSF